MQTKTSVRKSCPLTKIVALTKEGISKLPEDKPIVYKILTQAETNNFTGFAKRGAIQATLLTHLKSGKRYVPGSKVHTERMNSIDEAQAKAERIIKRSNPKYN